MLKRFSITVFTAMMLSIAAAAPQESEAGSEPELYGVIVGFTLNADGTLRDYRLAEFIDPDDKERKFTLELPEHAHQAIRNIITTRPAAPAFEDGNSKEKYIVVFYVPSAPQPIFTDAEDAYAAVLENRVRQFDLKTLERLGKQLYEEDVVAAEATDVVLAENYDLPGLKVKGWVTTGKRGNYRVVFVAGEEGRYYEVIEILFKKNKLKSVNQLEKTPLQGEALARFKARTLALTNIAAACSERYNTVVLDDPDGKGYLVYALSSTTDPDIIPVGGHYRFTVDETGETIERTDQLFKSCLPLDKGAFDPGKGEPAGMFMTNVVSPTPLETHVYLNLLHRIRFIVGTPDDRQWEIRKGKIRELVSEKERVKINY